jgi:hypothetical protein
MAMGSRFARRQLARVQAVHCLTLGIALAGGASASACTEDTPPQVSSVGGGGASGATSGGAAAGGTSAGMAAGNASSGSPSAGTSSTSGGSGSGGNAGSGGGGGNVSSGGSGGNVSSGGNAGGGVSGAGGSCPAGGSGGATASDTSDPDLDGVPNCLDGCPEDSSKTEPGTCGCGVAESDGDGDETLDCEDDCPADPLKTAPGECGCGISDTANADSDAVVDCKDDCPRDATRTVAGACGCLPDALGTSCLAHRYQFDGTGTVLTDSIAGASGEGTIVGATLSGSGTLVLAGGTTDQYVALPDRIVSSLGNSATIEAWVTWAGTGGDWQRIFDFGSSNGGADMQGGLGASYIFLSPRAADGGLRAAISPNNFDQEDLVAIAEPLPSATLRHLAVVVDGAAKTMTLYQDGAKRGDAATIRPTMSLTRLEDLNNWLGRSQYSGDEELAGTYHEFRIYSRALSSTQLAASFTAGPDALP